MRILFVFMLMFGVGMLMLVLPIGVARISCLVLWIVAVLAAVFAFRREEYQTR